MATRTPKNTAVRDRDLTGMSFDFELRDRLVGWAEGDLGSTAAVLLLCWNGNIPELMAGAGYVNGDAPLFAKAVDELDACTDTFGYDLSHSQVSMLRIAASLAGKRPVNLWRTLGSLDQRNAGLVRDALEIATGGRQ